MRRPISAVMTLVVVCLVAAGQEPAAPPSSEQSALIVFYRPKRFTGSGLTPSIYLDGEQIARLDNGRFFSISVPVGKHKIESSMKHAPLEIELKAGEAQYMEMVILPGTWRGGGRIIPAPAEDSLEAIKKLKPLDKNWVMSAKVGFETKITAPAAVK